ncbi:hypothetical protein MIMGU_mgv11b016817mg, partial [Erythranthe guttata]
FFSLTIHKTTSPTSFPKTHETITHLPSQTPKPNPCLFSAINRHSKIPASYWIWRVDPAFIAQERERRCFSPLWVAFSILIGGLLLDVLISVTLGGGT